MLISLNESVTTSEAEFADVFQEFEFNDCDYKRCQDLLEEMEEANSLANRLSMLIYVVFGFTALELTIACSPCCFCCFDTCRRGRCGEYAEFN